LKQVSKLFLGLGVIWFGSAVSAQANELKPFSTDGCSMWFDGTPEQPNLWRHCCVAHDLAYWQGGNEEQRKAADQAILDCVKIAQGSSMADYMYDNIRWGGSPYWMTSYRWGYGWDYWEGMKPRGYQEPNAAEQAQIDALLPAAKATQQQDLETHPVLPVPASSSASSSP
jgi:hypothetical protein